MGKGQSLHLFIHNRLWITFWVLFIADTYEPLSMSELARTIKHLDA